MRLFFRYFNWKSSSKHHWHLLGRLLYFSPGLSISILLTCHCGGASVLWNLLCHLWGGRQSWPLGDVFLGHSSFSPQLCSSCTLVSSPAVNCQLLSPSRPSTKTRLTLNQCHHPCLPQSFLPHLLEQRSCLVKKQIRAVEGLARKWDTNTSAGSGKEDESWDRTKVKGYEFEQPGTEWIWERRRPHPTMESGIRKSQH